MKLPPEAKESADLEITDADLEWFEWCRDEVRRNENTGGDSEATDEREG